MSEEFEPFRADEFYRCDREYQIAHAFKLLDRSDFEDITLNGTRIRGDQTTVNTGFFVA